ncbi:hypothetical protein AM218_14075 [Hymenobacter sp. DG25A]|nr:hypothetical protein AM218_14075 [Hymenobacter sp. DG25A]
MAVRPRVGRAATVAPRNLVVLVATATRSLRPSATSTGMPRAVPMMTAAKPIPAIGMSAR